MRCATEKRDLVILWLGEALVVNFGVVLGFKVLLGESAPSLPSRVFRLPF